MKTLDDFFEKVNEILQSDKFRDCPYPVYRGHAQGSYSLLPTLIRDYTKTDKDVWTLENNLYSDFKALAGPRIRFESTWEIVFAMRHEGVPTRLLDWTENIGTALFFALESEEVEAPHVWILNPYNLNKKNSEMGDTLMDPEEDLEAYHKSYADYCNKPFNCHELPIAVYPRRTNERIFAQRGLFTIHGKNESKMEDTCSECIERIDVSDELIPKLRITLKQFGINKYSVYPDFKGLGDYLKDQYRY